MTSYEDIETSVWEDFERFLRMKELEEEEEERIRNADNENEYEAVEQSDSEDCEMSSVTDPSVIVLSSDTDNDDQLTITISEDETDDSIIILDEDDDDHNQNIIDTPQVDVNQEGGAPGNVNIRSMYTFKVLDSVMWNNNIIHKRRYQVKFNDRMGQFGADNHRIYACALLDLASRVMTASPGAKMGIAISPRGGEALYVHARPIDQYTENFLEAEFEQVMQSSRTVDAAGDQLDVVLTFINDISGSGRRKGVFPVYKQLAGHPNLFLPQDQQQQAGGNNSIGGGPLSSSSSSSSEARRGTFTNNVKSYCLGTAIGRAISIIKMKANPGNLDLKRKASRWKDVNDTQPNVSSDCWITAQAILGRAGVHKSRDFTIDDVRMVQQSLRDHYQIIVLNDDFDPQPVYAGEFVARDRVIPLLYRDGHFELIFSLPQFLGTIFYCTLCFTKDSTERKHYTCPLKCSKCLVDSCPRHGTDNIRCKDCGVSFTLKECYDRHKQRTGGSTSRCTRTKICKKCDVSYYTDRGINHECGTGYCRACMCRAEPGHTHTLAVKPAPKELSERRIFFDLETMEEEDENDIRKHRVVLACALRCCRLCRDKIPTSRAEALKLECHGCSDDGHRYREFHCLDNPSRDVLEDFGKWLLQKAHKGSVVLAHNLKGFDGQLILQFALRPHIPKPQHLILCGRKINLLNIGGVRMIDSYNFCPFGLAKFSKAFDVPEITKGEFPFRFIEPKNFNYSDKIPDKYFYGYEEKNAAAKEKFDVFYEEKVKQNYVFDFKEDITAYCFSDVALLAAAMIKFEQGFFKKTKVMIFEEAVTAAGAAIKTFQRNFVKEGAMALDSDPSSTRIKQSAIGRRYLAYRQTLEDDRIQCVDNIGEYKVPGTSFHVDGFIAPCDKYKDGKAIEFYGCYFHAHTCLYSAHQIVRGVDTAMDIRQRDAERERRIREHVPLEVHWECEVIAEARTNKKLAAMLSQNLSYGPVVCREALFGGRTEVIRLFKDADALRKIHYLDFTSLYPFVMKTCPYPVGEGRKILGREIPCPITDVAQLRAACLGYMSCKVLAPSGLFIPVLPFRSQKLLFVLCRTCGETGNSGKCTHNEDERALFGTWTTVELELAISKGYKILKVFGAVHWDEWSDELFKEYINTFLREKQEASGWPSWVKNDQDRQRYVEEYAAKEGVRMNPASIKKDEVTRQIAKLLLNSLWGKFGQRVDTSTTHVVTTATGLYRLLNNPTLEVVNIEIYNDETITVQTRAVSGTLQALSTSCIQYAILTTAHARVKLYHALDEIPDPEENLLYMDTDSMIFAADRMLGNPLAKSTGEFLGQLTSETSPDGEMTSFVTVGAKSYCYREQLANGKEKISVKAKGFAMNADAERKIDYTIMRRQVDAVISLKDDEDIPETTVMYQTIKRKADHSLQNCTITKKFKFTFDKRVIRNDGGTIPFGFTRV